MARALGHKLLNPLFKLGTKCRIKLTPALTSAGCNFYSSEPEVPVSMIGRDFLTLKHFSPKEIHTLLWTAKDVKARYKGEIEKVSGEQLYQPLVGKSCALIFQKRSTRTRISSETGFALLGGKSCFLSPEDIHLGVNESIKDSGRVLSGFCDLVLARVYGQEILDELAEEASVPVISGLSDTYHPLQILADFLTVEETYGYLRGLKIAWVGDGNNIIHSFMMGCPKVGIDLRIATPQGYECFPHVTEDAMKFAAEYGTEMVFTDDPKVAVKNADIIVTDTWVSMGQEEEKQRRLKDFAGYQVTHQMLKEAATDWKFLHCLPRKKEEVSDEVFYDEERSLVWLGAENRKWTVMAVMLHLIADHKHVIPFPNYDRSQSLFKLLSY